MQAAAPRVHKVFRRRLILAATVVLYWAIGFYPYLLPPYENAAILSPNNGLVFDTPGIAYTPAPPAWLPAAIAASSLSIILQVEGARTQQDPWARIVTLARNKRDYNLAIVQEGNDLGVRVRCLENGVSSTCEYLIDHVFDKPGTQRIDIKLVAGLLRVSVNDREALREQLSPRAMSTWSSGHRLVLGNSPAFNRPWLGKIQSASVLVEGRRYDYRVPGTLVMPARYMPPLTDTYIQFLPFDDYRHRKKFDKDKLLNLLGFVPFGMILAVVFHGRQPLWVLTLHCCMMSLTIEVGQVFLAARTPSVDDLLLNTVGGGLGAGLLRVPLVKSSLQRIPGLFT